MQYAFNVELAKEYGVEVATFLNNILHWVTHNKANKTNFHDDCYWTYNTMEAYLELFPFWTYDQIRYVIKKCRANHLINVTNKYNKNKTDKTYWYTLTPKSAKLLNYNMWENSHMDVVNLPHGCGKIPTSIATDINTDLKPDNKLKSSSSRAELKKANEQKHVFADSMNQNANEKKHIEANNQSKFSDSPDFVKDLTQNMRINTNQKAPTLVNWTDERIEREVNERKSHGQDDNGNKSRSGSL